MPEPALKKISGKPMLLAVLSGILLFLSFPPFSCGFLAWFALLPLFFALTQIQSRGQAFGLGYAAGLTFFLAGIQWLTHVTVAGAYLLIAFEALFPALFAVLFFEARKLTQPVLRAYWIAGAWVFSEFLRTKFPVLGLGWNLLGYSQSDYGLILQSANIMGVYGVGFVLVWLQSTVFDFLTQNTFKKWAFASFLIPLLLLIPHGIFHSQQAGEKKGDLKISVIQGNIPQSVKWELVAKDKILEIYASLTQAAASEEPSLIIWPEAAFPGYFNRDKDAGPVQDLIRKLEIPTVVGAPHYAGDDIAFNSAYLVGHDGEIKQRYDKINLVPFGEYVPMGPVLDWLRPYAYAMGVSNFSAGTKPEVFRILNGEFSFSVLICFEDMFPELAKRFVDEGAEFLSVITNDAWFGNSGAPAQHMQGSIFRAVENGVPVVRAANTGISSFINNRGQVLGRLEKNGEAIFVTGYKTMALPVENKTTLFRLGGWVFPYLISALFVIMLLIQGISGKR